MVTQITNGVGVTVEVRYNEQHSQPNLSQYLFVYKITIENHLDLPIQLLKRHWEIFDSLQGHSTINGEGVVGEKPIIYPNDAYTYESFCNLTSDFGIMKGSYLMERKDGFRFEVEIPRFELITPSKLN
jgi:ApaG protein